MSTPQVGGSTFGASVLRREDARFLTGRGRFTDDVTLPGTTHAAFVRSPHAHARIHAIDTTRAEATPGVRAVFTAADLDVGDYQLCSCAARICEWHSRWLGAAGHEDGATAATRGRARPICRPGGGGRDRRQSVRRP